MRGDNVIPPPVDAHLRAVEQRGGGVRRPHERRAPAARSVLRRRDVAAERRRLLEAEGETLVGKVKGVYLFRVRQGRDGAEATWIVDAKNGSGSVEFNGTGK